MARQAELRRRIQAYVRELKRKGAIRSRAVERAFRLVERHKLLETFFVWPEGCPHDPSPGGFVEEHLDPAHLDSSLLRKVYADDALVTRLDEEGRPTSSTSQPGLVATMLEELELAPGLKVLEIGAGTGYNAALMAEIVGHQGRITAIDVQPDVVAQTSRLLSRAGYGGIRVLCRDGALGDPEGAPFDRIVATVGCPDISWRWAEQLSPEGLMLIPLQHGGPHCDPLAKLVRDGARLRGRIAGWSGFMRVQGELSAPGPWPSDEGYGGALQDCLPDRVYPLFRALARASPEEGTASEADRWAWYDFHYFLALCDRRAHIGMNGVGLADPQGRGMIVLTVGGIKLWGDESLYRDLVRCYRRWEALGRPRLTEWNVELFPKGTAPGAPSGREVWVVERPFSTQWAYLG